MQEGAELLSCPCSAPGQQGSALPQPPGLSLCHTEGSLQGHDPEGAHSCKLPFGLISSWHRRRETLSQQQHEGINCPTQSLWAAKSTRPGTEGPEQRTAPGQASKHSPGGARAGPVLSSSLIGTKNAKGRGLLHAQIPFHGPAAARPVAGGLVNTVPATPLPGPGLSRP